MKAIVSILFLMVLVDCGSFRFDAPYLCVGLSIVLIVGLLMRVVALEPGVADSDADLATTPSVPPDGAYGVARTLTQTIPLLVVEDDALILEMLTEALEEGGFIVQAATTAEQAIGILEAEATNFSALITDVNLPGKLTGWNVAKRAREVNEEIPVIYVTGGAAHDWASNGVPKSILLVKPFAPVQVITAVSQLLNAASGSSG